MSPRQPPILHGREWDPALLGMVALSGLLHLAAVLVVLLLPSRFRLGPVPLTAYTVELVTAERLAGTNVAAGARDKNKPAAPPKVEPKPEPPAPPPEEKKPDPPPPEAKKEEPKKVAEPEKEEPKPDEKAVALAAATKDQPARPTPTPVVQAKARPTAKVETQPKPSVAAVAATAPAKKPAGFPTPSKAEVEVRERDQRIAKAIERVKQHGSGGGTGGAGNKPGGGPLSVGPGPGAGGGVVRDVAWVMYYNRMMARLKEAWAWAGTTRELEADVRFSIGAEGEVSDVRITRSSGDVGYDASVLRAVRAASPLEPPPEAHRKDFSDVEITFSPATMNL